MTFNDSEEGLANHPRLTDEPPNWTMTISPSSGAWNLPLAELWQYRDLLVLLVRRDFVAFYKQTILGPAWLILQPLLTALTFFVVFGKIAGLPTDGAPKLLFYLLGVTFWNYFAECFIKTSEAFSSNAQLFSKVYFPRLIVPLAIIVSSLLRFLMQLTLLTVVWLWFVAKGEVSPKATILLLPLFLFLMALIGLGIGLIFSAATTKYRDLRFLIIFGVQLLMYATPIIYPLSIASGNWRLWMNCNPLTSLFEALRHGWFGVGEFSPWGLLWPTLFGVGSLILGLLLFNYIERSFVDTI